jgi:hypothetical protein
VRKAKKTLCVEKKNGLSAWEAPILSKIPRMPRLSILTSEKVTPL